MLIKTFLLTAVCAMFTCLGAVLAQTDTATACLEKHVVVYDSFIYKEPIRLRCGPASWYNAQNWKSGIHK